MKNKLSKILSFSLLGLLSVVVASQTSSTATAQKNLLSFPKEYSSLNQARTAADELNEKICDEGTVLLKNKDNALPMQSAGAVSVFGTRSADLYTGGNGVTGWIGTLPDPVKTIYDSLEDAGFTYNTALRNIYPHTTTPTFPEDLAENFGDEGAADYSKVESTYAAYSDAALIVIGRGGSENTDHQADVVNGKHVLQLTDEEEALIAYVKGQSFKKVILVLNTANAMELGTVAADDKIDAIVWIGLPGNAGIMALGQTLKGTNNPSGRLADIYPADFTKDPTYQNFGDNTQTGSSISVTSANEQSGSAIEYEEGIYNGYRYYETRGVEEVKKGNTNWYDENVVYPFGFGLSYTTFDWAMGQAMVDDNGNISVSVTVTNTGEMAGKDVVSLYYTAPYTAGGIEKSAVVLADYAKTSLLAPHGSETINFSLSLRDLASYDYNDANKDGHTGYELDAGEYTLKLQKNSHDLANDTCQYSFNVDTIQHYDTDAKTGYAIHNRFTGDNETGYNYNSVNPNMTIMSRADFAGTFPKAPTEEERTAQEYLNRMNHTYSLADESGEAWNITSVPDTFSQIPEDATDRTIRITFSDMIGVSLDDPKWDEFLNQFKFSELVAMATDGRYGTRLSELVGKPGSNYGDGLATVFSQYGMTDQDRGNQFACEVVIAATFNKDLAKQMGEAQAEIANQIGENGVYAPAVNTHRSQFSGRNFEYYSEDPVLAGYTAKAYTEGAQANGLSVFVKHFALNDQETNRSGIMTWASEQTMREIYLKAFEPSVKAGAKGIMVAMNSIGTVPCMQNYELCQGILRQEWGFDGSVVTDFFGGGRDNTLVRVGIDQPISIMGVTVDGTYDVSKNMVVVTTKDSEGNDVTVDSPNTYYYIRESAKRCFYMDTTNSTVNSVLDLTDFQGKTLNATANVNFDFNLAPEINGEVKPTKTSYKVNGTLPEGVTLDTETGELSGKAAAGTYTFDVAISCDYQLTESSIPMMPIPSMGMSMKVKDTTLTKTQTFVLKVDALDVDSSFDSTALEAKDTEMQKEIDELKQEKSTLESEIAALKTEIDSLKTSSDSKKSSGCGGSVIAATSAIGAVTLLGSALLLKKKREDK